MDELEVEQGFASFHRSLNRILRLRDVKAFKAHVAAHPLQAGKLSHCLGLSDELAEVEMYKAIGHKKEALPTKLSASPLRMLEAIKKLAHKRKRIHPQSWNFISRLSSVDIAIPFHHLMPMGAPAQKAV